MSAVNHPAVSDWSTDFDHLDIAWTENPYPIWRELRQRCPIAHTDRFVGVYLPTRFADVRAIAYDTEHFSSRRVVVRDAWAPLAPMRPITADPPEHFPHKAALVPLFSPAIVGKLEPRTREICRELIDRLPAGRCDAAHDYAREIPTRIFAHMLELPEPDGVLYQSWIRDILELGVSDPAVAMRGYQESGKYFLEQVRRCRDTPGDNVICRLIDAKVDGRSLSDIEVVNTLQMLMMAGIDSTWSAIACCLWHLATHPADRRRLVAEPELLPTAIEELLRAYAPVTSAREIVKEAEVSGCRFAAGQMVLMSFAAANRDPAVFVDPDRVIIDRRENRHAAFGLGIHRCLGLHLARMELAVALGEWLARIPQFTLDGEAKVEWSEGQMRGPRRLPIVFADHGDVPMSG
jgi:cytochrome P450